MQDSNVPGAGDSIDSYLRLVAKSDVDRERLLAVAPHPNRTGGSPASGFPVHGLDGLAQALDSTRTHHNARIKRSAKVVYPYHPLFGETLEVMGSAAGERDVVYVKLANNTTRGIPAWMFDEVTCAGVRTADQPVVDGHALLKLAELLDSVRAGPRSSGNETPLPSSQESTAQLAQPPAGPAVGRPRSKPAVPGRKSDQVRAAVAGIARSRRAAKGSANRRER